ncbi:MAG: hypothetical protein HKN42_19945 [Granulosicoccus sp.]|nr:hypothetical protein [Granulosicoccus sp.]
MMFSRCSIAIAVSLCLIACTEPDSREEDIDKLVAEMSQRVVAPTAREMRGKLIPRYNQPKTIACLSGEFTVLDDLPDELRHGLFQHPATYPVAARFANASKWDDSEKDIRGLSLRVSNVPGETLWGLAAEQDFLFNSYPALFVATPEEFLAFMRARQKGDRISLARFFLSPYDAHIRSLITILKARDKHTSPLDIRYWSTVPSALDNRLANSDVLPADTQAVKYSMTPCSAYRTERVVEPGENQLRAAVKSHLQRAPVCFEFGIQTQTDPVSMPVDDASVIWDEEISPFQTVATVTFNAQSVDDEVTLARCERRQFNPWQTLPAHTPLGRMNAVRKAVYATGAYLRANRSNP